MQYHIEEAPLSSLTTGIENKIIIFHSRRMHCENIYLYAFKKLRKYYVVKEFFLKYFTLRFCCTYTGLSSIGVPDLHYLLLSNCHLSFLTAGDIELPASILARHNSFLLAVCFSFLNFPFTVTMKEFQAVLPVLVLQLLVFRSRFTEMEKISIAIDHERCAHIS